MLRCLILFVGKMLETAKNDVATISLRLCSVIQFKLHYATILFVPASMRYDWFNCNSQEVRDKNRRDK